MKSIVLDPFVGSGTTIRACKKLNRHFIGIDINPESAKLIDSEPNTDFDNPIDSIFIGDNLEIMEELYKIHGSFIDLIYADPPFGRNSADKNWMNWNDYPIDNDILSICFGSGIIKKMSYQSKAYLTWIYPRLEIMKLLLKSTGSMYLHCDPKMV